MVEQLGVALDPFRPTEVVTAPGVLPSCCPFCRGRLQDIARNEKGDTLFECLNDGYEAVLRVTADDQGRREVNGIWVQGPWEPRPRFGVSSTEWRPPVDSGQPTAPPPPPPVTAPAPPAAKAPRPRPVRAPRDEAVTPPLVAAAMPTPSAEPEMQGAPAPAADVAWVTLADAADITGVKPDAIYRRVRRGTLVAQRGADGRVMVRADQLDKGEDG